MFTLQDLTRLLSIEQKLIRSQTEGLSQSDTLIQPQPSGNCMNWVLGHTLDSQVEMLVVLGGEPPFDWDEVAAYRRESDPITGEGPGVLPLERLLALHAAVYERLAARLGEMNEADFAAEIEFRGRTITLGWRVFFLHFHYNYHLGQLELLRQLAGRTEKVI